MNTSNERTLPAEEIHEFKLESGETYRTNRTESIRWLNELLTWYSEQEKDWHQKAYHSGVSFNTSYEREWMRYQSEVCALKLAIKVLSGEQ
jgi:hypothetical protein